VNGAGGNTSQFLVNGPWNNITIGQTGGAMASNTLSGSISSTTAGTPPPSNFSATYATTTALGTNAHTLALSSGGTVGATIAVNNSGASPNAITDNLTADGAITYGLTVNGTGNNVTNTIAGATSISLTDIIGTAATTDPVAAAVNANNNTIANSSIGSGAKTISVTLLGSNNTATNAFGSSTDAQSSTLTTDALSSHVNYELDAAATTGGTSATVNLYNVVGTSGTPAVVNVAQSGGGGDSASLTVQGGGYTMGTISGGLEGSISGKTAGVQVQQTSPGAMLVATVTAAGNGYTASFKQ
jgi:hypothetical protein